MRLGKKERAALRITEHSRRAVKARQERVEALPKSNLYTSLSRVELDLHPGRKARWEFSEKNDRLYTGKGMKV